MVLNKTIAILICWYGPYPWYLGYFIRSCFYNLSIDFIIITNNKENIANKPENVIIVNKTINEIRAVASEKLGFGSKY